MERTDLPNTVQSSEVFSPDSHGRESMQTFTHQLLIESQTYSVLGVIVDQPICDIKLSSAFFVNSMKLW